MFMCSFSDCSVLSTQINVNKQSRTTSSSIKGHSIYLRNPDNPLQCLMHVLDFAQLATDQYRVISTELNY